MTIVNTSITIAKKKTPNDKIYTPHSLVERHITHVAELFLPNDTIYEPFSGDGRYVTALKNKFPDNAILHTEIDSGSDFFLFTDDVDVIISNPPYSIIDKVLKKSVELKPRVISYLFGYVNVTPKRIAFLNNNGYFIAKFLLCRVRTWFGITAIITVSNDITKNLIDVEPYEFNDLTNRKHLT